LLMRALRALSSVFGESSSSSLFCLWWEFSELSLLSFKSSRALIPFLGSSCCLSSVLSTSSFSLREKWNIVFSLRENQIIILPLCAKVSGEHLTQLCTERKRVFTLFLRRSFCLIFFAEWTIPVGWKLWRQKNCNKLRTSTGIEPELRIADTNDVLRSSSELLDWV